MKWKSVVKRNWDLAKGILIKFYRRYLTLRKKLYTSVKEPSYNGKIFCIGYNKTGTTSLGRSLQILGYNHSSYDHTVYKKYYVKNYDIDKILKYTAKFESFDDLPWNMTDMIPILDKAFPGSKFIYLERDEKSWMNSVHHWYFKKFGEYPDLVKYLKRFRNHRKFILDYFKHRLDKDLIIINIQDEEGFKKLGRFLGRPAPINNFPHHNKTTNIPFKPLSKKKISLN